MGCECHCISNWNSFNRHLVDDYRVQRQSFSRGRVIFRCDDIHYCIPKAGRDEVKQGNNKVNGYYVSKNIKNSEFLPQLNYMRTVRVPLALEVRIQLLQYTSSKGVLKSRGRLGLHV